MGTMEDAEALIKGLHDRGMKVVFDMVLNHTSEQHPWFLESSSSRDNAKADWYIWRDGSGKEGRRPPNNWRSITGPNGWQWHEGRKQWYFASFLPFQPDLNYHNPEVKAAMKEVLRFWLRKGVDGFRLDIFNAIVKDKDFRPNPFSFNPFPTKDGMNHLFQRREMTVNHPGNFALAKEIRAVVDEFPERFLVGEVFGQHEQIKQFLGEQQDGLNLIFLFDMLFFRWSKAFFEGKIIEHNCHYPAPFMPTFVVGNHDNKRSIGRLGGDLEKAKLLALMQMTQRAVPVIYYGEEIGMLDADIAIGEAQDPLSKQYGWVPKFVRNWLPLPLNRDVSRTPMQWEQGDQAGFSQGKNQTWLPISAELDKRNVRSQKDAPDSLLNCYRGLLHLRKEETCLRSGSIEVLSNPSPILAYKREWEGECLVILLNFGKGEAELHLNQKEGEIIWQTGKCRRMDGKFRMGIHAGLIFRCRGAFPQPDKN
jgi:oligo-1,6-glucosidase/alpha-glucosidase